MAMSTCELWTSLDIECLNTSTDRSLFPRGALKAWFSRVRGHGLSLAIHTKSRTLDPQICDHLEPLDILAILPRLWRLDIDFPASECRQLIPYNTPLPMLQCLDAAFHNADCEDVLRNAPLLAELSWHRSMGTANLPNHQDIHDFAPLTFANLESLRFSRPSPHALDLPTLPNLARLGCDLSSDPEMIHLDLFSSFETLAISSVEVESLLDLTSREDNKDGRSSLMLSKLRNLKIKHPNHIVPSDYNYILDLNH
ncbi:hypothetical protein B0H14DRAFT_3650092 [Mycena olivaceomarginata]|nr:hypothetical protein B0H14DRAFT_3650092 [Mycena olivaceomarginata]